MLGRLRRLPVRWALALTSAGLTFAILLLFALVIGLFTAQQVRSDFDDDLSLDAANLQQLVRVRETPFEGFTLQGRRFLEAQEAGESAVRVVNAGGGVLFATAEARAFPPPQERTVEAGGYRVVTRPFYASSRPDAIAYLQYGKPASSIKATLARVQFFLLLGVGGGTGLALLAGLAVASRAIAPIARLTAAAKEIARTRDAAVRMPKPAADDEVADLSRTLEEMLMALDAAQGETAAALDRQREFVADASHELRTPLTSVLANLELLEARLAGEDLEITESALRSSLRMRRLVADLLLLARADTGREAPTGPVDLGDVLREAVAEEAPIADAHELELEASPGLVVSGVADDLHRIALNLIRNAIEHTPPGTSVRASARREGSDVVMEVADDGPGIPAELREHVFERFVRGEGDAAAVGGSGLGLAIVRAVAEAHGGSARAGEAPEGGALVNVRLPALAGEAHDGLAARPVRSRPSTVGGVREVR